MSYINNKTILVTGGSGFLGFHICKELKKYRPKKIIIPRKKKYDLTIRSNVDRLLDLEKPNIIIHAAGRVGGIEETRKHPADFFYSNASMAINIIDSGYKHSIEKFVGVGSVCSYPKYAKIPFVEEDLWNGYPEETNAPYGIAKKIMLVQSRAYQKQYNFNGIHLLCVNLYGPKDNFNLKTSHVIAGMIKKLSDAKEQGLKNVIFWGDGSPTREFLYVDDCARAIVLATEFYNGSDPVNIGSGIEISIKELAEKIKHLINFHGKIIWDKSKPNGQPRRCLDITKAKKLFGFKAKINFNDGLKKTINWYKHSIRKY